MFFAKGKERLVQVLPGKGFTGCSSPSFHRRWREGDKRSDVGWVFACVQSQVCAKRIMSC